MNISVIIATFGDSSWTKQAARAAVSAQGQGAHELIILHQDKETLASVRNQAAAAASGDWLVFLDADDELAPGYLDAMRQRWTEGAITTDWAPLLVPAVSFFVEPRPHEPVIATVPEIPQRGRWPQLNECVIGTAVSKRLFEQVGGFRGWPSLEDYDLFLRCYDAGARLVYVEDAIYRARLRVDGRNADQSPYHDIWQEHLGRELYGA